MSVVVIFALLAWSTFRFAVTSLPGTTRKTLFLHIPLFWRRCHAPEILSYQFRANTGDKLQLFRLIEISVLFPVGNDCTCPVQADSFQLG